MNMMGFPRYDLTAWLSPAAAAAHRPSPSRPQLVFGFIPHLCIHKMYSTMAFRTSAAAPLRTLFAAFFAAVGRLDKSLSPVDTITRLQAHAFAKSDAIYILHIILAIFWLIIMEVPSFPSKLFIPLLYIIALLIPFTSQLFLPATPVFAWFLAFYTNRFIPSDLRPAVHVVLLPTLESVLYGANISDILTRSYPPHPRHQSRGSPTALSTTPTHSSSPSSFGSSVLHFALKTWAKAFGYMSLTAVLIQILIPCAAPCLHAGWATLGALFITHFWDGTARYVWTYVGVLYWSTMYLTHHYLIDVVGGACLATVFFYLFMPDELRAHGGHAARSKYEQYDLEARRPGIGCGRVCE
ncbi:hypothetical protein J3R82DRAFT_7678 [Butyriboletus roseoflavus]|nr:hypothetical protein J3R82DRAFT_7678 [Butyriboletus roseoflavus]